MIFRGFLPGPGPTSAVGPFVSQFRQAIRVLTGLVSNGVDEAFDVRSGPILFPLYVWCVVVTQAIYTYIIYISIPSL